MTKYVILSILYYFKQVGRVIFFTSHNIYTCKLQFKFGQDNTLLLSVFVK